MNCCEKYISVAQPSILQAYLGPSLFHTVKDNRATKLRQLNKQQGAKPCLASFFSLVLLEKKIISIKLLAEICLASVGDGVDHFKLRGNVLSRVETLA